jgi:choline dehydrogenase-like flavoprotein
MAETHTADVVVIGSGVAGALVAHQLATAGVDVLILEAGPRVTRDQIVANFEVDPIKSPESSYPDSAHGPRPTVVALGDYYVQEGPDTFGSTYQRVVGGTTWHWLGTVLRMHPNDFRARSEYGVADDWPISYDELARWYDKAEHELGVSGDAGALVGPPGPKKFRLPMIPQSYADNAVAAALAGTDMVVSPTPQARNSVASDGRPACCGNHQCIPVCPVGAKYDATVHLTKAEKAGARLLDNAVVHAIDVAGNGLIHRVRFKRPDGTEGEATANTFVLAAHAIEGPKLLLMSRTDALPNGVANSSGQVGRNLMDHPVQLSWCTTADPVNGYRGPLSTSGIENLSDGPFRSDRGAFRIELANDGWNFPGRPPYLTSKDLTAQGLRGSALREALRQRAMRDFRTASLVEQLPDADNRVELADGQRDALGLPRPRIHYRVDGYTQAGMAESRRRHDQIFDALGATFREHATSPFGAGHIMGTTRMGSNPATSVVDREQRSWDHPNLFCLGSGTFVTSGTANPTLTLAALALWAAETIERQVTRTDTPDRAAAAV